MKQTITKEQWDELSDEQKLKYSESDTNIEELEFFMKDNYLNIGQMIEFLGDDVSGIINHYKSWNVLDVNQNSPVKGHKKELVDALWEAVKEKLNET